MMIKLHPNVEAYPMQLLKKTLKSFTLECERGVENEELHEESKDYLLDIG